MSEKLYVLIKNHLFLSHAQSVDLSSEIVVDLRARLQLLRQVALSCRQVGAHLWHRGPVVSRQQRGINTYQYSRSNDGD